MTLGARCVRAALCLFACATATAACRRDARPSVQGPYGDKVAQDVSEIEKEVGVRFKRMPKLEMRTREEVRQYLVQKFDESEPQQELAGEEATYKLLGLLPDTMNLRKFLTDLLTEQVIGYYDPKAKVLYVVSGAPEEYVGITIMHELVHALQDQYVNLDSLQHLTGDDDRQEAAQAVVEGQATFEQMAIMIGGSGNIATRLPGGWDRIRENIREAQSSMPIFSSAPMVMQEELLFPYINGADFIRRFKTERPGRLPWDTLPVSTQQVMHDSAFFGKVREQPLRVSLPRTPGILYENDMGEFGTRLFLFQHLQDQNGSIRASSGWAGDRYQLVKTPAGNAFAWITAWRTPVDAAQFVDALGQATIKRYRTSPPTLGGAGMRTYHAAKRTVVITPRDIGGTSAVIVTDVPAGSSPAVLDVSRVSIGR